MRALELFLNGLALFGFNPRATISSCKGLPFYIRDFLTIKKQARHSTSGNSFPFGIPFPCLYERFIEAGDTQGTYFHQDLFVARRVFANKPEKHLDVGSSIGGFISHVASFRKITVVDIRPLESDIPNVEFVQADMMGKVPENLVASTDSLSCLHAMEHFGLGRYGDTVCYDGYMRGIDNLGELLKPGGKLYFSVPMGPQRIEFNAHRVFSTRLLLDLFSQKYKLDSFSYIDDASKFFENAPIAPERVAANYGCNRGLGILELTKL
jgi:SAM-dependent methyltransferase